MDVTRRGGRPKSIAFGPRGYCRGQGKEQDEYASEILWISELEEGI